jgi:SAM-dependent methyltransferase
MDKKEHWESVYRSKKDTEVSWHQAEPCISLELILEASGGRGRVIDVGGGSSVLIDRLLGHPFDRLAVLDISEAALERARSRLGAEARRVEWIAGDITDALPLGEFDTWHDRAVFHFLTDADDREKYL